MKGLLGCAQNPVCSRYFRAESLSLYPDLDVYNLVAVLKVSMVAPPPGIVSSIRNFFSLCRPTTPGADCSTDGAACPDPGGSARPCTCYSKKWAPRDASWTTDGGATRRIGLCAMSTADYPAADHTATACPVVDVSTDTRTARHTAAARHVPAPDQMPSPTPAAAMNRLRTGSEAVPSDQPGWFTRSGCSRTDLDRSDYLLAGRHHTGPTTFGVLASDADLDAAFDEHLPTDG